MGTNRIARFWAGFEAAWNAHDARAVAAHFEEGATFEFLDGRIFRGRAEIAAFYAAAFAQMPAGWQHRVWIENEAGLKSAGSVQIVDLDKAVRCLEAGYEFELTAQNWLQHLKLIPREEVRRYLAAHPAHYETVENWPVQGRLRVRLGLGATLPPVSVSSSVLAIVFREDRQVLYLYPAERTGSITQLLIGGRPQAGESPADTVIREVAEETGWLVKPIRMIGFRHFQHLEPHRPQSDRPYPDFIQPIYVAQAESFDEKLIVSDDLISAKFMDYALVESLIELPQRPLLQAARKALG